MQKINTLQEQELFMQRCLELSLNGLGSVAPNPMVGAVIVCNGKVVGEGYHRKYGEAHAEVNAIRSVKDPALFAKSTMYVNLEPCSHTGKTPPCSDLIIAKGIPRVVIGTIDPNSLVAGKGIKKLKAAGVEVTTDILAEECYELNRRFFTFHKKKRPYLILKWAQTLDGFMDIDRMPGTPIGVNWISSPVSRTLVHRWRSEEQGILVGTNTVIADNPRLNLRYWSGKNPTRIVLDRNLRLPDDAAVFDNSSETLIYNHRAEKNINNLFYIKKSFTTTDLLPVLQDLYKRNVTSVLIEGGKSVLNYFIDNGLWDEARVFIGNKKFEKGLKAPIIKNGNAFKTKVSNDRLLIYKNNK